MSKKRKHRLRMAEKRKNSAPSPSSSASKDPKVALMESRIQEGQLQVDYIDHNEQGTLFLNLIQERYAYPLNVDDYHFHYFMAAGNEFIGIAECQISEDLDTIWVTKALINQGQQDLAMVTLGGMLGDAFEKVYIGQSHWIKDGEFSRMFNPLSCPEITARQFVVTDGGLDEYLG